MQVLSRNPGNSNPGPQSCFMQLRDAVLKFEEIPAEVKANIPFPEGRSFSLAWSVLERSTGKCLDCELLID